MIKTYYLLTKPGIIAGNLITTASAFVLASRGSIDYRLFLATTIGLFFVIASACVFNNYIDRKADGKMARTKNRALVKGTISVRQACVFAILLGCLGFVSLALYTNLLAAGVALFGFFVYVVLYSFWKYHTSYATLVGSIAGAVPPVVGYCAASNRFDAGALLVFVILVLWQMPHFFSIAMYRSHEYAAASIPVLPVKSGNFVTKIHMLAYVIAFMAVSLMPTLFGLTGEVYLVVAVLLGISWLGLSIRGFRAENDFRWARKMFALSLAVITILCFAMSLDVVPLDLVNNEVAILP